jgi:hypothetical protein
MFHLNSVDYNLRLDQLLLSAPTFNEIWIIDHGSTIAEEADSSGGRLSQEGGLLYRWGNPITYGRGSTADQSLGFQHDAQWIPQDYPGGGNILLFNNRSPRLVNTDSEIVELVTPLDASGRYLIESGLPFGPIEPLWTYSNAATLRAAYLSGVQRLWNGNTLITIGPQGRLVEIDPEGRIVWQYDSPFPESDALANTANARAIFKATRYPMDYPGLRELVH